MWDADGSPLRLPKSYLHGSHEKYSSYFSNYSTRLLEPKPLPQKWQLALDWIYTNYWIVVLLFSKLLILLWLSNIPLR
jgi:hypothetical protein